MHAIFISIPVLRPEGIPDMKPLSECVEEIPADEIQRPGETHRSTLPKGVNRTEQKDIDMGLVCRVDDVGEYNDDGTYTPTHCRIYFRLAGLPPIDIGITRQEFMQVLNRTTQQFAAQMNSMQRNQIVEAGAMPPQMQR